MIVKRTVLKRRNIAKIYILVLNHKDKLRRRDVDGLVHVRVN